MVLLTICIFLVACCPGFAAAPETTPPELHFAVAEWAYEVWGEGDYDPNPEGRFLRGERGYAYLEVSGFSLGEENGLHFLKLAVDVALQTKGGFTLFSQKDVLELEEWYLEPPETTWFYIWVDIPKWAPRGVYRTRLTVRDLLSEEVLQEVREIAVY